MTYLHPTANLRKKVNPDGAKSAGPLLHGWARRTSRGMVATQRHVRALVNYLPTASASVFASLGGGDTLEWANKAVDAIGLEDAHPVTGENEILVLGLPYGGPNGGKDSDEQFFSPMTDFFDGISPSPPVMYTHGTQNGFSPEPVGSVRARWYDRRGGWFKVTLDPQSPRYAQLLEAHSGGYLRASTGVVPASYSTDLSTGHIDTWLVGELSLVDMRDGYSPVNGYAITKAAVTDILFTDYYGDGVKVGTMDIQNLVTAFVQAIKDHFKDHMVLKEGHEELMAIIESEDSAEGEVKTGFQDPLYKAKVGETKQLDPETEVPCTECEEAKRLGNLLKAELVAPAESLKCSRCPEAISWIRGMVKAAKVAPLEAFQLIDRFTQSDEGFDILKSEVEARTSLGISKARQDGLNLTIVPPITGVDPQTLIDPEHMAKQRRLAGLPKK